MPTNHNKNSLLPNTIISVLLLVTLLTASLPATAKDSHVKWQDVASIEWGSHKITGTPSQVKIKNISVLVKMKDGQVKKIWQAKIKLKDGQIVFVEKGRAIKGNNK